MLVHEGTGVVNTLINKLPFEVHIPGYQFCGPGTRLQERLQRGDRGINPLDAACREHDIAYSQYKDLEARHRADAVLAEKAWQRVWARDANLGEKAAAWSVTNMMKAKRKLGMGVIKKKCKRKNKRNATKSTTTKKGRGSGKLTALGAILRSARQAIKKAKPATVEEASKVAFVAARKAVQKSGGKKKIRVPRVIPVPKSGGLLPLLPALFGGLAALGTLAGGASAIAKTVNTAKSAKEKLSEMRRHNEKMEAIALGRGMYLGRRRNKSGFGIWIGKKPKN